MIYRDYDKDPLLSREVRFLKKRGPSDPPGLWATVITVDGGYFAPLRALTLL